jgi:diacylglycerol kinase (ATP)
MQLLRPNQFQKLKVVVQMLCANPPAVVSVVFTRSDRIFHPFAPLSVDYSNTSFDDFLVGSAPTKRIDLGILTSPDGHRIFIESAGLGLLPIFMSEMRLLEKKNGSKERLNAENRLFDAMKYLGKLTKPFPGAECELLLDDEIVTGDFLILEVSNMRFIGPNLDLFPDADPRDGQLDIVSVDFDRRKEWQEYLKALRRGEKSEAPVKTRRCRKAVFRCVEVPVHVDGKVFLTMASPISIRCQPGVLEVLDFS